MAEPGLDAGAVAGRVAMVRDRIARAGGHDVALVAVTKGFGPDAVRAALANGLTDLGENYAQELVDKAGSLEPANEKAGAAGPRTDDVGSLEPAIANVRWHFIGRLQRNKVRGLAAHVALWQTVDREALAIEIAKRQPAASVLIQLDLSGEPQKGGCRLDEATALVARCGALGLRVEGLMGVGPAGAAEAARPGFRRLVALADELELPVRSIGMSGDLEVAVEEGSTMVRVGRDLFGPRPVRSGGF